MLNRYQHQPGEPGDYASKWLGALDIVAGLAARWFLRHLPRPRG